MLDDFQRLYEYVGGLVNSRFKNHPVMTTDPALDLEDLVQTGMEHALKALTEYDASLGTTWETWVGTYAIQGVRNYLRDECNNRYLERPDQHEYPVYMWEKLLGRASKESMMIDHLGIGHDLMITRALDVLSGLQSKALLYTNGILVDEPVTQNELANSAGASRNQVQYALERAKYLLSQDPEMIDWYNNCE